MSDILGGWAIGHAMGNAARPTDALGAELARRERARDEERQSDLEDRVKKARGTIHNVRVKLNARVEAEAALLAQLNEAGVNVPLGSMDALSELATEKYFELFEDQKVVETTYNFSKKLPNEERWYMEDLKEKVAAGTAKVKWHG